MQVHAFLNSRGRVSTSNRAQINFSAAWRSSPAVNPPSLSAFCLEREKKKEGRFNWPWHFRGSWFVLSVSCVVREPKDDDGKQKHTDGCLSRTDNFSSHIVSDCTDFSQVCSFVAASSWSVTNYLGLWSNLSCLRWRPWNWQTSYCTDWVEGLMWMLG